MYTYKQVCVLLREVEAEGKLQTDCPRSLDQPRALLPIVFTKCMGVLLPTPWGRLGTVLSANQLEKGAKVTPCPSVGGPRASVLPQV